MTQESGARLAGQLVQEAHERAKQRREQERQDKARIPEKAARLARGKHNAD